MTLAQVQGVVAFVTALFFSWVALQIAVALTLPEQTAKAEAALREKPKRCLWNGIALALLLLPGIIGLSIAPLRLLGVAILLTLGATVVMGAAGLAKLMGARIAELAGQQGNSFANLLKGSLVYSAALLFPFIGWWLFLPISTLYALGAGAMALWPKRKTVRNMPSLPNTPQMDVTGVA